MRAPKLQTAIPSCLRKPDFFISRDVTEQLQAVPLNRFIHLAFVLRRVGGQYSVRILLLLKYRTPLRPPQDHLMLFLTCFTKSMISRRLRRPPNHCGMHAGQATQHAQVYYEIKVIPILWITINRPPIPRAIVAINRIRLYHKMV